MINIENRDILRLNGTIHQLVKEKVPVNKLLLTLALTCLAAHPLVAMESTSLKSFGVPRSPSPEHDGVPGPESESKKQTLESKNHPTIHIQLDPEWLEKKIQPRKLLIPNQVTLLDYYNPNYRFLTKS